MNQPKPEQEPSMEEILASIRRIISEDGEEGDAEVEATAAEAVPEPAEAPPPLEAVATEDDVLELTEVVAEEPAPEPDPEPEPEPEPEPDDDVELELQEPALDDAPLDLEEPSEPPAMEEPLAQAPAEDDSLVADSTALMASAAMSRLTESTTGEGADTSGALQIGDKTIEALVRELMRPMLKDWLDHNLPAIVERIVEREVKRVAERLHSD